MVISDTHNDLSTVLLFSINIIKIACDLKIWATQLEMMPISQEYPSLTQNNAFPFSVYWKLQNSISFSEYINRKQNRWILEIFQNVDDTIGEILL